MGQIAPFEAPRLKIERSKRHVTDLRGAVEAYFAERPCALVVEKFPNEEAPNTLAWIARIRHPVPLSISPIIGDVVHNLRAALDLLACDLVRLNHKSTRKVSFPFSTREEDLSKAIKERNFHLAGADVVQATRRLKPYSGGNLALRAIHDVDLADKHQSLLPVIRGIHVPIREILGAGSDFPMPQLSTLVVKDGQIIVGLPARAAPHLSLGAELPFRSVLTFGDGFGFDGCELFEFLHNLTETANGVIDALSALRPGAAFPDAETSTTNDG